MAAIFEASSNRVTLRLNTGTDPNTGKSILKAVSFDAATAATANQVDLASKALSPLLAHTTISVETSGISILGDDGL